MRGALGRARLSGQRGHAGRAEDGPERPREEGCVSAADVIEAVAAAGARAGSQSEPDGRQSPPPAEADGDSAPRELFKVLDLSQLGNGAPPASEQEWFWGLYVPAGHLTHFGSHGGAGKSTIGLMLAVCAA